MGPHFRTIYTQAKQFSRLPSELLPWDDALVNRCIDVAATYFLFEDETEREKNLEIARMNALLLAMGGQPREAEVTWESVEEFE